MNSTSLATDLRKNESFENFGCGNIDNNIPFIEFNRNELGEITSINYYLDERELEKQVFYENSEISKIRYYQNNKVRKINEYKLGLLIESKIYDKEGFSKYQIKYEYDNLNRINNIVKIVNNKEYAIKYVYDSLGRIILRRIYVDFIEQFFQEYKYDILDNLIEYSDSNQHIRVENYVDNKLSTYRIIDRKEKEIFVKNKFKSGKYVCTTLTTEGRDIIEKNEYYVDNVMLKKPMASLEDFDLIISQLKPKEETNFVKNVGNSNIKVDNVLDEYIKVKIFPISLRKRVLYNLSLKVNV